MHVCLSCSLVQSTTGWEEYWDYIFPDDEKALPNLKLLEKARMWKRQKLNSGLAGGGATEDNDTTMGQGGASSSDAAPAGVGTGAGAEAMETDADQQ